ncbi:MAG: hypothetical protein HOE62_01630 [Alphaproteobacteria bacterium]|jgi:protocatechuate 4,5-dioxygenase alpha chain|nr:hypothetical protein [Alphaproteobacteria bacterium]MBT4016620.1 hypothetical protein [Alphaproteobacteria bacterium]MBT4964710.1 hypothetical protein [Alphaproteobacteria bacterium]MBT5161161.1 hypothetical protein [Alphaproteobacteria bacterium]MBT7746628.1 hypothetical protein [Alphaproteobacteria bacterium]
MANEFNPDLPSNILIFEVRRDPALYTGFADRMEEVMETYKLSEAERAAWRSVDVVALAELGVHPYFLPQVTRLIHGSADNDSNSNAAQAYRKAFGDQIVEHEKK